MTYGSLVLRGLIAARPAAGSEGRLYFASDTQQTFRDNGSSWDDVSDTAGGGVVTLTTKGDLLTRTASAEDRLAVGTDGYVVTADSSQAKGIKWAAPSSGALVLLEQHTASSSAQLDFTSWYSSSYDEYLIEVINIIPATTNCNLQLQFSTDGGSSWAAGSTDYVWCTWDWATPGGGANGSNGANALALCHNIKISASFSTNGVYRLYAPGGSNWKQMTGQTTLITGTVIEGQLLTGAWKGTTAVNGIRFTLSGPVNISSGTIRIYGLAK